MQNYPIIFIECNIKPPKNLITSQGLCLFLHVDALSLKWSLDLKFDYNFLFIYFVFPSHFLLQVQIMNHNIWCDIPMYIYLGPWCWKLNWFPGFLRKIYQENGKNSWKSILKIISRSHTFIAKYCVHWRALLLQCLSSCWDVYFYFFP